MPRLSACFSAAIGGGRGFAGNRADRKATATGEVGGQTGIKSYDSSIKLAVFESVASRCVITVITVAHLTVSRRKMRCSVVTVVVVAVCCFLALRVMAEEDTARQRDRQLSPVNLGGAAIDDRLDSGAVHTREKRTLFLKKKLLGAGLLGFGLGIAKGYKAGYYSAPEVHHVYLSPPMKYVQYVEKPVYIERIVPKPVYGPPHNEYEPHWSQPEPSPSYGGW